MAFGLVIAMTLLFGVVWIFNPFLAHRRRTTRERWTTRERSHGHPFYWVMRYGDRDSAYDFDAPLHPPNDCKSHHHHLYNRPVKAECNVKNIIYIE